MYRLEKKNLELRDKVENLERQAKKNNIVIFGINKPFHQTSPYDICQEVSEILQIDLSESDVSDIYSLGKIGILISK